MTTTTADQKPAAIEVKSAKALAESDDYRRAIVNGRRFDMTRVSHRAGHMGRRYTVITWLITERNPVTGAYIQDVEDKRRSAPSTIKAAEDVIARFITRTA